MKTCGTYSGYTIHIQKRIPPCDACRKASRDYQRNKRNERILKFGYDPRRFKRYNLTVEQYEILLNKYDGKCWICKDSDAIHIDHNHNCCKEGSSCGKCVRGVLCSNCNTAIGLMSDSIEKLNKAIKYLSKF